MSRACRTEYKNQKHKRVTKSHFTMKKTSTPNKTGVARPPDISLSEISESATSSSSGSKKALLLKPSETIVIESQQKNLKKNKRVRQNRRMQFSSQSSVSTTILEQSEWETVEEKTDKSLASSTSKEHDNTENIKLFEDLSCIPEITREGIAFESLYESPIVRRSRRLYLKNNIQRDDLLPINLPLMEERDRLEEMYEDEISLHRESNVKTYLTAREVKNKQDKLWYQILASNGWGELNELLASTSSFALRSSTEKLSAPQNLKTKVSKQLFECDEDDPIPGRMCVRGSLDRKTYEGKGQWTRTYKYGTKIIKRKRINKRKMEEESDSQSDIDIYSKRDKVDVEFETAGSFGKRMTLAEFRHRQKII